MQKELIQGYIKRLHLEKRYGFIITQAGDSVFFHASAVVNPYFTELKEDRTVEFYLKKDDKTGRLQAVGVSVV